MVACKARLATMPMTKPAAVAVIRFIFFPLLPIQTA
jgi:hypothetical protein